MKKMKKGFTLIELLVVIAIIGILATTLAPKLREQLAKAKDSKAIALLGAARVAGGVAIVDTMVTSPTAVTITFGDITSKLDKKSNDLIDNTTGDIAVGAKRNSGTLTYGVNVALYQDLATDKKMTTSSTTISITSDEVELVLGTGTPADESTEGKVWLDY